MKVFVTGGSGFIGSSVIAELIEKGHSVVALARSDKSAGIVRDLGAEVLKGDLNDIYALKKGAQERDGTSRFCSRL
jgi:uncharacterized protein YbjT (DUF2867 family)